MGERSADGAVSQSLLPWPWRAPRSCIRDQVRLARPELEGDGCPLVGAVEGEAIDIGMTSGLIRLARRLRMNQTDAEKKLWRAIRSNQIYETKFRRQFPVPPYIVDFCSEAANLVVEVDGGQHMERIEEDRLRTEFLQRRGYEVLRFTNVDILTNLEGVLEVIGQKVSTRR